MLTIVAHVRWELPQVWPERMRALTQVSESTYLEAPPFPSDPATALLKRQLHRGAGQDDGRAGEEQGARVHCR
jgi:hypothetical protein